MQLKCLLFGPLLGLAAAAGQSTSTKQTCATVSGTRSVKPVPTTTQSYKQTFTVLKTKYEQKTVIVTPKPVTNTEKKTTIVTISTTLAARTSNVQVIATDYTTSTITAATTTFTSTRTIATKATSTRTDTVTVPTSSGFIPIQKSLQDATDANSGSPLKRDALMERMAEKRATKLYPQKVQCKRTTFIPKTVTTTQTKAATTITAGTPTRTITDIQTVKTTQTMVPSDVTIFTTSTTQSIIRKTSTPSTTVTTTTTITTSTVIAPGPSVYAMCAKNNFGSSKNNKGGFTNFYLPFGTVRDTPSVKNAYQCCDACARTVGCMSFYYSSGQGCVTLFTDGSRDCSSKDICEGGVTWTENSQVLYTFGNGPYLRLNKYGTW